MKTLVIILLGLLTMTAEAKFDNPNGDPELSRVSLSGKVKDKTSGETLIGAAIYISELSTGAVTDESGNFSINLKKGTYNLVISYMGYESLRQQIILNKPTELNINLKETSTVMNEVVVSSVKKNENTTKTEMSTVKMNVEQIKSVPALMGEVDVVKVMQLMPGVQGSGEGLSGFSVRGGSAEQNLVLLDEVPVYNSSHLIGLFSVFNNDVVKEVKLYKGDIPASYGGRLSSMLDVQTKDGNLKKFSGTASVGTISSKLSVEAPLLKDKCSFVLAGRRSYADLLLRASSDTGISSNKLYFYDFNYRVNYNINPYNKLTISGYTGKDVYGYTSILGMDWGNSTQNIKWNHIFTKKLYSNISVYHSSYIFNIKLSEALAGFKWYSKIDDYSFKANVNYYPNDRHKIQIGYNVIYHVFNPGKTSQNGNESILDNQIPKNYALEHGIYISDEQTINARISLDYGIRLSIFQNIGSATVYNYDADHHALDSNVYGKGEVFNTYAGLEPRLGIKYELSKNSSVKASYSRTRQYIQLASNSLGGTPMDIWFPSNPNVKPQTADQVAMGYFRNFMENNFETSVEVYYKNMNNQIDFKDHASLIMNEKLEGELRFGTARAYGAEFLVRKQSGHLNGWISYTLSKSEKKIDGINNNEYYRSNYDKTHNISVVTSYEVSKRLSISGSWVFITGAPTTLPTGKYVYGNTIIPVYSDRNGSRLPNYHRLDISATLKGKDKPGKKYKGEWNFSIYNVYNRKNTFCFTFEQSKEDPSRTQAYKVYLLPILPAITYNVKF